MARVTYGSLITELKGSIGGSTFQQNASGSIVRSRPFTPVNPSALQSAQQLVLIKLVALWGSVSIANKALWAALAVSHDRVNDWGNSVHLSGYQWFLSYNLICASQGIAFQLNPQAFVVADPPSQFTLSADVDGLYIDWAAPESFPGTFSGIFATVPLRQTSIKLRKSTFLINLWATGNTSQIDITAWYESTFNITWADFYTDSQAAIIVRMKNYLEDTGYASPFTSNIIMIG